jgi:hypothetical protein
MHRFLFLILFITGTSVFAQQNKVIVFGYVRDSLNQPISNVNITESVSGVYTISGENGYYQIEIDAEKSVELAFSYIGRPTRMIRIPARHAGERFKSDVEMQYGIRLSEYTVTEERDREKVSMQTIDPRSVSSLPNTTGSFETVLKTLPGVTSNNEMSAQYNVRGGNYDENLIYVNDIEIYRPFLPRTGQQEGLSFIHSELVQNVKFSAGGFESRYGDKLSSVLDIRYRDPKKFASSVNVSLLGAQVSAEGASPNKRFTAVIGARYWTNQLLVGSLDTKGDYRPSFADVQTWLTWHLKDNLSVSFLGSYAQNKYLVVPQTRETVFGTVKNAVALRMVFNGSDLMEYRTSTMAVMLNFQPTNKLQLKAYASLFLTDESEFFTIEGGYKLEEVETNFGSDNFGRARASLGIGYFLNNARNRLNATIINAGHRGYFTHDNHYFQWGAQIQHEEITDKINEWRFVDSLGFAKPGLNENGQIVMNEYITGNNHVVSYRLSGYVQDAFTMNKAYHMILNYGIRSNWWSLNDENVVSPRIQFSVEPNRPHNRAVLSKLKDGVLKKDLILKVAFGVYYQPPIYREFRRFDGSMNLNIRAQRSIHYIVGGDMNFRAWNRPFKFFGEAYYKKLDNLIPYETDNVRIRYYANNIASGYATGIDLRVNGEFVKGTESWASISLLSTQEKLTQDVNGNPINMGYVRRPTDQRFSASIMFQDYLPKFPSFRMYLNLVYGSGFPFGPPDHNRYGDTLDMPSYKRVDIGFLKIIVDENSKKASDWRKYFKSAQIGLEVFNLLDINNTISYLWLQDISGRTWAVPNFLTSRRLNLRVIAKF